jgi:multiple sugar transport system permease protein
MGKGESGAKGSRKNRVWMWFVLPALIVVLIIGVVPLFYSIYISVHQYNLAKTQIAFKYVGLKNYLSLVKDKLFWNSFRRTAIFVAASVTAELALGTVLALLLLNLVRGRDILRSLFLIPMIITPIAVGLMGRYIFDDAIGIVNHVFRALRLPRIIWYGDPKFALLTMIILDTWEWSSFVFLIVLAGMMGIPPEYYEAAKIEGAGALVQYFKITLPTLRNVYLLAMMVRIIDSLKEFDKVYIMTKGGPNFSTDLITIRNYTIAFKEFNIGLGSAFSLFILFVMILLGTVLIRTIQREY